MSLVLIYKVIQMKKLLIIFLIVSVIFISGCTSEKITNSETSIDSQNNQQSDTQNPELIIRQSDVPGLSLNGYNFYAVPKSTPEIGLDDYNIDEVNETNVMLILMIPGMGLPGMGPDKLGQEYDNVLPIGTRNVGQSSTWKDESGREVKVILRKFDSSKSFHNYYAEAWDFLVDYANQNPQKLSDGGWITMDYINNKVDLNIGDYSYYISKQNQYNPDVQETSLMMLYENNCVSISVKGEVGESENDAIRIAKKIKSRLD